MEIELIDLSGPEHPGLSAAAPPPRPPRVPRRVRTTAVVTIAVTVALLAMTGGALSIRRSQLERALDHDLDRRAVDLEAAVLDDPVTPRLDGVVDGDRFAQVLQSPGVVVATSPDLGTGPLPVIVPRPGGRSWTTTDVSVAGKVERLRVAARALATPQGVASSTVVVVAGTRREVDDGVAATRTLLLVITALLAIGAAAATWMLTGRRRPDR